MFFRLFNIDSATMYYIGEKDEYILTRAVCSHSLALRIAVKSGLYLG